VFTAFGISATSLVAAGGTLAEQNPPDAEAMTLAVKTVAALVVFTAVSVFAIAGIYFGLVFALRDERKAREELEKRLAKLESERG